MKDRHILLNNWLYEICKDPLIASIMELKGEQAVYHYIKAEFEVDIIKSFAQIAKEMKFTSIAKEKS